MLKTIQDEMDDNNYDDPNNSNFIIDAGKATEVHESDDDAVC